MRCTVGAAIEAHARLVADAVAVQRALGRLEVVGFPMRMEVTCAVEGWKVMLRVRLQVHDRDTGEPRWLCTQRELPRWVRLRMIIDAEDLARVAAGQVAAAVEHELRECVYVDGARPLDPHA